MNTDDILELVKTAAIEPWEELGRRLTEQKAIESANSAEARECGRVAGEIVRLAGAFGLDSGDLAGRSDEWMLVSAAAGRSRLLSSAARRPTLSAAACFEADGKGGYRFIHNRISIVHPTAGSHEFLATAAAAIKFLLTEPGIESGWPAQIPEGPQAFNPSVVLDAGPDKDRVFQELKIQFYKRDASGTLAKYDPKNWQLELKNSE